MNRRNRMSQESGDPRLVSGYLPITGRDRLEQASASGGGLQVPQVLRKGVS